MSRKIKFSSRRETPWSDKEEQTLLEKLIDRSNHDLYDAHHTPLSESWGTDFINENEPDRCQHCGSMIIENKVIQEAVYRGITAVAAEGHLHRLLEYCLTAISLQLMILQDYTYTKWFQNVFIAL